jgi:hypothetical protein
MLLLKREDMRDRNIYAAVGSGHPRARGGRRDWLAANGFERDRTVALVTLTKRRLAEP